MHALRSLDDMLCLKKSFNNWFVKLIDLLLTTYLSVNTNLYLGDFCIG